MARLFHEIHSRSLAKALSLRVIIIIADVIIIYSLTHRYDITISVIVFTNLIGTFIHFAHERIWNKIRWGRKSL